MIKLSVDGFFKILTNINIEMADGIVDYFCIFPQILFSFYSPL